MLPAMLNYLSFLIICLSVLIVAILQEKYLPTPAVRLQLLSGLWLPLSDPPVSTDLKCMLGICACAEQGLELFFTMYVRYVRQAFFTGLG